MKRSMKLFKETTEKMFSVLFPPPGLAFSCLLFFFQFKSIPGFQGPNKPCQYMISSTAWFLIGSIPMQPLQTKLILDKRKET